MSAFEAFMGRHFVLVLGAGYWLRAQVEDFRRRRRTGSTVREAVTGRKPDVKLPKVTESA